MNGITRLQAVMPNVKTIVCSIYTSYISLISFKATYREVLFDR